jgi:cupin 2 domain-containing protein
VGHSSAPDFWYDQTETELVFVIQGHAKLEFEDQIIDLVPGSFVTIQPHQRHRVHATSSEPPCIWLAIFYP